MRIAGISVGCFVFCSVAFAVDQARIDAFCSALKQACESKDIAGINKLYCADGASEPLLDQAVYDWETWLVKYASKQNWTVDTVAFFPKEQYLARPNVNKQAVADAAEPQKMNGHSYGPNLDVVGFVTVKFKEPAGGSMTRLNAVGVAPDGSLRIVARKRL